MLEHIKHAKKQGIKPILGNEIYVSHQPAQLRSKENRWLTHQVVWAKNYEGWKQLIKLTSHSNDPRLFYYRNRIYPWNTTFEDGSFCYGLEHFCDGNLQTFSGHQGSHLSDNLFCNLYSENPAEEKKKLKKAYSQYKESDIEFYRKFLKEDWLESTCELALKFEKMFGKGNFFVEVQNGLNPKDRLALWIHPLIVECLRIVSKEIGIPAVASSDPHYARPEDAPDQRLMVMVNMKQTEAGVQAKLDSESEDDVMVFFGSDNFYIHSYEEMAAKFTKEELDNTLKIADQVEEYDISHKPYLPKFDVPEFPRNDFSGLCKSIEDEYLIYLCIEGAKQKRPWEKSEIEKEKYWDRLKEEFEVIVKSGLSGYFLLIWDICMSADFCPKDKSFDWRNNLKNNKAIDPISRGPARGSAGGCIISYLCGITGMDPIKYGLFFGRFYNEGRNTKDHIEYPDIDLDFCVLGREWIIKYIEWKYGKENVAQIVTFQKMQGRAALKDVFRVKGIQGGFDLANEISQYIPNESEVLDEIQEMKDSGEEDYGLIRWAIDNEPEMKKYYNDPLLKHCFDQAIRCEGRKRGKGKHPSGVIATPNKTEECFPMVFDPKTKERIIGVDMNDAAKLGGIKGDILGVSAITKLKFAQDLINKNEK